MEYMKLRRSKGAGYMHPEMKAEMDRVEMEMQRQESNGAGIHAGHTLSTCEASIFRHCLGLDSCHATTNLRCSTPVPFVNPAVGIHYGSTPRNIRVTEMLYNRKMYSGWDLQHYFSLVDRLCQILRQTGM